MEQTHRHDIPNQRINGEEANVIPLRKPDFENLDPNELSDTECIALYLCAWQHPALPKEKLAEAIMHDTSHDGDAWRDRLSTIVAESPLTGSGRYDEFMKDDTIAAIAAYMTETKDHAQHFALERKAALTLMQLGAVQLDEAESTEDVAKVFEKLLKVHQP